MKETQSGHEKILVSDLKNEIEGLDEKQKSREVVDSFSGQVIPDNEILQEKHKFKVVAEDDTDTLYSIAFLDRDQAAPQGVGTQPGYLTGVNSKMEYASVTDDSSSDLEWNSIEETDLWESNKISVPEGKYKVRYKAGDGLKAGEPTETITVAREISNETKIKIKEPKNVVEKIELMGPVGSIDVYKTKMTESGYIDSKLSDILSEIESEDGSSQLHIIERRTETQQDPNNPTNQVGPETDIKNIPSGTMITVYSENYKNGGPKAMYLINVVDRPQTKPEGVSGGEGKITGLKKGMEYRLSTGSDEDWINVEEDGDAINLEAGTYIVRYGANTDLGLLASESVELEVQ